MKKPALIITALLLLFLAACGAKADLSDETTAEPASTATETTIQITLPNPLPPPELIILGDSYDYDAGAIMSYRQIYYGFSGPIMELADYEKYGKEPDYKENEMPVVSWIRHYKIEKEDFVAAVQRIYESCVTQEGFDIYKEECEMFNADIIYTFDNEIINDYYRRER